MKDSLSSIINSFADEIEVILEETDPEAWSLDSDGLITSAMELVNILADGLDQRIDPDTIRTLCAEIAGKLTQIAYLKGEL